MRYIINILFYFSLGHTSLPDELENAMKPLLMKLAIKSSIKIEVDPSDLLTDCVAFYKGPKFNPQHPLRVTFIGQPALDSGGVKRQMYTDLFKEMVSKDQLKIFEGPTNNLLFNYNQTALSCGLYKMLGQMVAHSICQGCGGFPYLAPPMYYYIATSDINQASAYASIKDVHNEEEMKYIEKVLLKPMFGYTYCCGLYL